MQQDERLRLIEKESGAKSGVAMSMSQSLGIKPLPNCLLVTLNSLKADDITSQHKYFVTLDKEDPDEQSEEQAEPEEYDIEKEQTEEKSENETSEANETATEQQSRPATVEPGTEEAQKTQDPQTANEPEQEKVQEKQKTAHNKLATALFKLDFRSKKANELKKQLDKVEEIIKKIRTR